MAYRHARSGACESDTAIASLVPVELVMTFGGTERGVIWPSFGMEQMADGTPARVSCKVFGFTPAVGETFTFADDGVTRYLFTGTVVRVKALNQVGEPVIWNVQVVDNQWLLNKHDLVYEKFANVAANVAVAHIVSTYTDPSAGFSVGCAVPGNVTLELNGATVSEAIDRIAVSRGALWYVDPYKQVCLFTTLPDGASLTIADASEVEELEFEEATTQTRNRVIAEGGGSRTTARVAAGATEIPVENIAGFVAGSVAAPKARSAGMLISYTGTDAQGGAGNLTGCTGIVRDIPLGDPVIFANLQENTTAQTAMATALGGGMSGRVVHSARSTRLDSVQDAEDVAAADLDAYEDPLESLTFRTVNPNFRAGKTLTASVTTPFAVSGTFRIQAVRSRFRGDPSARTATEYELIREIDARPILRRTVTNLLKDQ